MRRQASLLQTLMLVLALVLADSLGVLAVEPDEILANAELEQRARNISRELRCMVCQNESIDDSHAPLARDLRLIVRERLLAGDSDAAVFNFLTARYGDYVLLRPRLTARTLLLWLAPILVLGGGIGVAAFAFVRRGRSAQTMPSPLSAAEKAALSRLLASAEEAPTLPKRNPSETSA